MAPSNKKKKRKRSSRNRTTSCGADGGGGGGISNNNNNKSRRHNYVDLMVPIPIPSTSTTSSASQRRQRLPFVRDLLKRFEEAGYASVALTHRIFGLPRPRRDRSRVAFDFLERDGGGTLSSSSSPSSSSPSSLSSVKLLRRLHAVVENVSDVGRYASASAVTEAAAAASTAVDSSSAQSSSPSSLARLLEGYDVVSVSPRNDAAFRAACGGSVVGSEQRRQRTTTSSSATSSGASAIDVVSLDYCCGNNDYKLPFKIRSADLKSAYEAGVAFEIQYSPAVLDVGGRRRQAFVRTCREFYAASAALPRNRRPKLLLSSGNRSLAAADGSSGGTDGDAGPLAIRAPADLINLLRVVGGIDDERTRVGALLGCVGALAPRNVSERRRRRRRRGRGGNGNNTVTVEVADVSVVEYSVRDGEEGKKKNRPKKKKKVAATTSKPGDDDDDDDERNTVGEKARDRNDPGGSEEEDRVEDGFISLS